MDNITTSRIGLLQGHCWSEKKWITNTVYIDWLIFKLMEYRMKIPITKLQHDA